MASQRRWACPRGSVASSFSQRCTTTGSRTFKSMQARGLIAFSLDGTDGRLRLATLTQHRRDLHDQLI
jgi:hypothetical protein